MLTLLGDIQIPLLAAMLLSGCLTKVTRAVRTRSMAAALGPTALFPLKMRAPVGLVMCATECGLGIGLILTAGSYGGGAPAFLVRVGTGLLFLVATFALIELRSVRPDVGCGCFGEFSQTPVTGRTIVRSALLAVCALATMRLRIQLPESPGHAAVLLLMFVAELTVLALLSPEIRDVLVRIGYSAPCELRVVSPEQTLTALHRSAQWRKHAPLIAAQEPSDTWRELCWRYVAYPSQHAGREAEVVFAVRIESRRPAVLSALVDTATGAVLPWPVPAGATRHGRSAAPARLGRRRHGLARSPLAQHADPRSLAEPASLPGSLPSVRNSGARTRFPPL
jgi:hypothetical protein